MNAPTKHSYTIHQDQSHFGWNNANIPLPMTNPLTTNVTKLFFFNKGTGTATPAVATVTAGFLLKQETQTS